MSHKHEHSTQKNLPTRPLLWSVAINLALSVFQFFAGIVSGSAALLADALHNTNDAAALVVAYIARRVSKKRANFRYTFGYRRAELIGALIQLTALVIIAGFLVYHAIDRIFHPAAIDGSWMILGASVAILIDLTTVGLLWATSKDSLNTKSAMLHNFTDAGASVAVLVGGLAVYYLNWVWVDTAITLGLALIVVTFSIKMLSQTSRILMEATPEDVDLNSIKKQAENLTGVQDIHHVHVWELDEAHRALEAHVVIEDEFTHRQPAIKKGLKTLFSEQFNISHSTLEFERSTEACRGREAKLVSVH